jgi:hypothetical protein
LTSSFPDPPAPSRPAGVVGAGGRQGARIGFPAFDASERLCYTQTAQRLCFRASSLLAPCNCGIRRYFSRPGERRRKADETIGFKHIGTYPRFALIPRHSPIELICVFGSRQPMIAFSGIGRNRFHTSSTCRSGSTAPQVIVLRVGRRVCTRRRDSLQRIFPLRLETNS